ncbi:diguanylate cyclase [Marivivens marinus]|uniref:diguanylate cyclase n=1 Tax=Marivivens marinus TaxID=3110173 RepID=UPI003B847458
MSGRILIVDGVATNRIVLKVKLLAAQYAVVPRSDPQSAMQAVQTDRPDLILIETSRLSDEVRGFIQSVRTAASTRAIPIIAMGHFNGPADRLAALQAGADDVLDKPLSDTLLLARIRSLLRAHDADAELRLREDTERALGFCEEPAAFDGIAPGKIVLIADPVARAVGLSQALGAGARDRVRALDPDRVLSPGGLDDVPDVFVIDARNGAGLIDSGRVFSLLADLRSRVETRHCSQFVLTPDGDDETAAMVLDLGANDVAGASVGLEEIGWRIAQLAQRKARTDRLRDTVRNGLQAAVTDPLTGLYNRRYALPHIDRMADRARETGQDIAVMVLDIDHFKRINDTHGHAVGDAVLVGVAERLRSNLRAVDLVARIGGEEFLVAMPDCDEATARIAAERLRRAVEAEPFQLSSGATINVTLSAGVAVAHGMSADLPDMTRVVNAADHALFAAKSAGRNTVSISQSAA